ncbi:MAG TPA: capsular biosynthesis protein [Burkholderiaceae bacterium]
MNDRRHQRVAFARLLSSAVVSQTLLSAASFAVNLMLIRSTADAQYAYFILASNAILLAVSLQNAMFTPPLSTRMGQLGAQERADLVGGLYRTLRRMLPIAGTALVLVTLGLWVARVLDVHSGPLMLAAVGATLVILHREYFRVVLFAHRQPGGVLRADAAHVVLVVACVWIATFTPMPAAAGIFSMGVAALVSGALLSRTVQRHEPWNRDAAPGGLRRFAPLVVWSTLGAATHWTFGQGYIYLVAATLDVSAVAALAATRLLLMPVNLLSSGIGTLMLPVASGWLHRHDFALVLRRLCLMAAGLSVIALVYFAIVWLSRDWIFGVLVKKEFPQRDLLLLLWGGAFFVMVLRDQLAYLLTAQGRFRVLTLLTLGCAMLSLVVSYAAMQRFGAAGALVGMLVGELINLLGIVMLALRRSPPLAAAAA